MIGALPFNVFRPQGRAMRKRSDWTIMLRVAVSFVMHFCTCDTFKWILIAYPCVYVSMLLMMS